MAVTNKIWNSVYSNFKTLLETTLASDVNNALKESENQLDIKQSPTSIYSGNYLLQFKGLSDFSYEINNTLKYTLSLNLQIGYEINLNDAAKASYNKAVNDIETIFIKRLDSATFPSTILDIKGESVSELIGETEGVAFLFCTMDFTIKGRFNF